VRVLIDYRPALRQRTGVGEYAHQLASALVPRLQPDGRVVLFSSSWKDRLPPAAIAGAETVDSRIPVRVLNRAWHRWEWPPVESLAGRVDVAHSMHPLMLPSRRAARVITIHDLYFLDHAEDTEREIRGDYAELAPSHAQRCEAIVAVSEYTAAQIRSRFDVAAEKIVVCSPASPRRPSVAQGRRDSAGHGGPVAILFVGTLETRKNVQVLLEAYGRLLAIKPQSPPLVLAGRAGAGAEAVLGRLNQPPLAGKVQHLGYVSDERRDQLLRDAALLVMPSLDEGFGMPALEAMTIGVPVVAANRGALPEVVGDAGLLVEPDADALANAMTRILDDPSLAQRLRHAGIERAKRFTWDASAAKLMDVYRAAIALRLASLAQGRRG
jgi:glycosyltransferase involved in cell wall biosynthesis